MNRKNKRLVLIVCIVILIVVMILLVIKAKRRLSTAPVFKIRPIPVKVVKVKKQEVEYKIHYLARLDSDLSSDISPRITAQIIKIYKDEGDVVKKGDLLCELYDQDILNKVREVKAKIEELKAKLSAAKADILSAESEYQYISSEYKRIKELYKGKAASRSSLDEIKAKYDISKQKVLALKENYKSLQMALNGAHATLNQAKVELSYTKLRAPYDGVISERLLDVGDMAIVSRPIFRIYSPDKAKLVFSLVQEDVNNIKPGMAVKIGWPTEYKDITLPKLKKITKVYPSIVSGKTTIAEAYLGRLPDGVKIGSFIPIDVIIKKEMGLCIPSSGIVPIKENVKGVYLVKNNKLELVQVQVKLSTPDLSIIEGKVKEGDMVVVGDYLKWTQLSPGMEVRVIL